MNKELKDLVDAAMAFCRESENVRDNPQKLLAADKLGAAECTRVGDECARSMDKYGKTMEVLREAAFKFFSYMNLYPMELFESLPRFRSKAAEEAATPEERKIIQQIGFAFSALRFIVADREFALSPTAHRSHGGHGPEVERFFECREELEWRYRHSP